MGEIRSIPAGILSAAWLDCDKYSKIYAGIFASCMKSDQSFHTGLVIVALNIFSLGILLTKSD